MSGHISTLLIGLPGVADHERPAARRWAAHFEVPMILLAIWIMIEWYLAEKGIYPKSFDRITNWSIWLFFVLETTVLTSLVENKLHWCLDVSFADDDRRIRKGHGAENYARLSRIALNLLKAQTRHKVGIRTKRLCCGWSHDYLFRVLTRNDQGL